MTVHAGTSYLYNYAITGKADENTSQATIRITVMY